MSDFLSSAPADPGFLYLAENQPIYKIGITTNPKQRLAHLRMHGAPMPSDWARPPEWKTKNIQLLHLIPVNNMRAAEMYVWENVSGARCGSSEWFQLTPDDIEWICSLSEINSDVISAPFIGRRIHCTFRELLAAKAQRENRPISVRKACAEAGITWRIGYGMADDTISAFPRDDLSKLCAYLECDLSDLLVMEETTPP